MVIILLYIKVGGIIMKRIIPYILTFIIITMLGEYWIKISIDKNVAQNSPNSPNFSLIGANLIVSHIDCWAKINIADIYDYEKNKKTFIKLLDKLGISISPEQIKYSFNNDDKFVISYCDEKQNLFALINVLEENKSYFLLQSDLTDENNDIEKIIKIMENDLKATSYYQHTGVINAYIPQAEQENLLNVILKNLKAEPVERFQQKNVVSITGFSNLDIPTIKCKNKKYNMQVAMRSNINEGKSYVYLGFPLLLDNY
jgi:hypothetical protein